MSGEEQGRLPANWLERQVAPTHRTEAGKNVTLRQPTISRYRGQHTETVSGSPKGSQGEPES